MVMCVWRLAGGQLQSCQVLGSPWKAEPRQGCTTAACADWGGEGAGDRGLGAAALPLW